jgi:folylpolyglutamate synthase/dihydropteroate synthase
MAETADIRVHSGGADFTLRNKAPPGVSAGAGDLRLSLPVPGGFQAENAALAITALRLAGFDKTGFAEAGMDEGALRRGLSAFSLPARFERLGGDPVIIVDGAHTPVSVSRCAETFRALYGEGILLFGCAADKDPGALAAALDRGFARRIITGTGTFRPSDPAGVFQAFRVRGIPAALAPDPAAALDAALAASRESARSGGGEGGTSALPILCCGSFYLAAEIRARVFTR